MKKLSSQGKGVRMVIWLIFLGFIIGFLVGVLI